MSEAIQGLKKYLRRKYATNDAGLLALADTVFGQAGETVILSHSSDAGSSSAQARYNKAELLGAIEELIEEKGLAPATPGRDLMVYGDFSGGYATT